MSLSISMKIKGFKTEAEANKKCEELYNSAPPGDMAVTKKGKKWRIEIDGDAEEIIDAASSWANDFLIPGDD